jgi:hypothetical protein
MNSGELITGINSKNIEQKMAKTQVKSFSDYALKTV